MSSAITLHEGSSPVILSAPHVGTKLPRALDERLNERGRMLADTDWHVDRLYHGCLANATTIAAQYSRYVVDLNRPPEGGSLYPGQNTTATCPTTDFDGHPIYRTGQEPDEAEVAERVATYHAPYHTAIREQIERLWARHGAVLLYDCHSIRSVIPHLFDGELPQLNIGTNEGATCAPPLETIACQGCQAAERDGGYTWVLNGRFKGGWTTRHYGRPDANVHAIQMEIAQRAYMQEAPPWRFDAQRATRVRPFLAGLLGHLEQAVLELGGKHGA